MTSRAGRFFENIRGAAYPIFLLFFSCVLLVALGFSSCSRKKDKEELKQNFASELVTSFPLLKQLPENTSAFLVFDNQSEAAKRLSSSPWGELSQLPLAQMGQGGTIVQKVLKNAGLNPQDQKSIAKLFKRGVLFSAPLAVDKGKTAVALLYESDPSMDLASFFQGLKKEFEQQGEKVAEAKFSNASGFRMELGGNAEAEGAGKVPVFFAWRESRSVIASHLPLVETLLQGAGDKAPALIETSSFQESIKGFGGAEKRLAFGYVDIERLLNGYDKLPFNLGAETPAGGEVLKQPFRTLAFSSDFEETPTKLIRLSYAPQDDRQKQWFQAVGMSTGGELAKTLPADSLFLASIDGQTLRRFKDLLSKTETLSGEKLQKQLNVLDSVNRLGLLTRAAPVGEAMLPVPNLALILVGKDMAQTKQTLEQLILEGLKEANVATPGWEEVEIGSNKAKILRTPLGVGVFMAAMGEKLLVASSQSFLQTLLSGQEVGGLDALPQEAKALLTEKQTVATFFISFPQLAVLLESLQGMLSMYAPQDQMKGMMDQEVLGQLKKMGAALSSLESEEGAFLIKTSMVVWPVKQ